MQDSVAAPIMLKVMLCLSKREIGHLLDVNIEANNKGVRTHSMRLNCLQVKSQ